MPAMFTVAPVEAFNDNYIWLLQRDGVAVAVDPGEAAPLQRELVARGLRLGAVLITHHHADHCGGVAELGRHWPDLRVHGPAGVAGVTHPAAEGDDIELPFARARVIAVPGHTLDHLAYQMDGMLFCGDTLFAAGCGRVFEGTPAQMLASLKKLARLPPETKIFPAHEYTLSNLRFALAADPANPLLAMRQSRDQSLRERNLPTLPTTLHLELASNPFLRCLTPDILRALTAREGRPMTDETDAFSCLRAWKNDFR